MKTRIVYPKLWFDEKFNAVGNEAKVLFFYIITNDHCGLTRYLHVTDRQILFDTNLTPSELVKAKKELETLRWAFFTENWVFQAHEAAYVDYEGRDRVLQAKDKELSKIPSKVIDYFNPLITRYKPILNPKPETINNKPKTINKEAIDSLKKKRKELGI